MKHLASLDNTVFIGQSVGYAGNGIYGTLEGIPLSKRIEMPVAEDMQMGISIGLSLHGFLPISIFPRMDFLIIAMNQLVNHMDKISEMSCGQFNPKVIIRTAIGSKVPLDGGIQHTQDYTEGLRAMLKNVVVLKLDSKEMIWDSYMKAMGKPTILIESSDLYET